MRIITVFRTLEISIFCGMIFNFLQNSSAHPQCLDFKAPFQAGATLNFCPMYTSFGCCTVQNDKELRRKYDEIGKKINSNLMRKCGGYLRELMCQKCSPYAAHIYDAEDSFVPKSFPGLCQWFCESFFRRCKEIIPYMTNDINLLQVIPHGTNAFCEQVQLIDKDYCYPDLKRNPVLNNKVSIKQVTSEGCLCMEEIAAGLKNPVLARHAGDGSNRLFVAEVSGKVYIYYTNGSKEAEPFLDIQKRVVNTKNEGDERGFLGMAFHPNFTDNQKFYVYYSTYNPEEEDHDHKIKISEMKVSRFDSNKADTAYERTLLEIKQPFWNHNGGEILFGDDNFLYLFVGDGGAAGDPLGNGQNRSTLLGKVLRIDVDSRSSSKPYGIPRDNPFIGERGVLPEIYAYGVRNIWRCGKDRGDPKTGEGKGRIVCGDVGQSAYEELDLLKKGVNYGWNAKEGFSCFRKFLCKSVGKTEPPIHSYPHYIGKSVTGGHFYRGCHSPNLNGFYIYGDYMNGKLFRLLQQGSGWNNSEINMCKSDMCKSPLQSFYAPHIMSFGEDEDGEMYMLSTEIPSSEQPLGRVYRIVDPSRRGNPENCRSARHAQLDSKRAEINLYSGFPQQPNHHTSAAPSIGIRNIKVYSRPVRWTSARKPRPKHLISKENRQRHRNRSRNVLQTSQRLQRIRNVRQHTRNHPHGNKNYRAGKVARKGNRKARLLKLCKYRKRKKACRRYRRLYVLNDHNW